MTTPSIDTGTPGPGSGIVFFLLVIVTISVLAEKASDIFLIAVQLAIWCRAPVEAENGSILLPPLAQLGSELHLHDCVHTLALHMGSLWTQSLKS